MKFLHTTNSEMIVKWKQIQLKIKHQKHIFFQMVWLTMIKISDILCEKEELRYANTARQTALSKSSFC